VRYLKVKVKKTLLITILSVVIVVETFVFSLAGATAVSNWGVLAGLFFERLTTPIVNTLVEQFNNLIQFLEKNSLLPNVLKSFSVVNYQRVLSNTYTDAYQQTLQKTSQLIQTPSDWIRITEEGHVVPPVFVGREALGDFSKYAGYVSGDMKVVYDAFNRLNSENSENLDEISKAQLLVKIRELDAAKIALMQKVVDDSASSKVLQKLLNNLEVTYEKIDAAQREKGYTKAQAMKDLVKVQALNTQLMNELVRRMINYRTINVAMAKKELDEERNKLLTELQALHTEVKGKWTLEKPAR